MPLTTNLQSVQQGSCGIQYQRLSKYMKQQTTFAVAGAVGLVCGLIIQKSGLSGHGWYNLIFLGIVGVVIGANVHEKKNAGWAGVFFGMFTAFTFSFSGFGEIPNKAFDFLMFIISALIFGPVGSLYGWLCALLGNTLRRIILR